MLDDENRKLMLAEILRTAQWGRDQSPTGTPQRREFSRIARLTKRLYVEHLKSERIPE